jgi:anti-repressor protein
VNTEIQQFYFHNAALRTLTDEAGEPWSVAKDVCDILGHSNVSMALDRLDDDERPKFKLGRQGETNIVNEAGLYSLVLGSRKPEAHELKRWVTHEELPSIRKHGAYMTQQTLNKALTSPDFLIQLATKSKEEQEKVKELEPKTRFADAVATSDGTRLIGKLAKMPRQNGLDIGQNRLLEIPRHDGYLGKTGSNRNMPTQRAMDLGRSESRKPPSPIRTAT